MNKDKEKRNENKTEEEKKLLCATKKNVWPKPDWTALIRSGTPDYVAYWQSEMWKSLVSKCPPDVEPERYIEFAGIIRDAVMNVKTDDDIKFFLKRTLIDNGFLTPVPETYNHVTITGIAEGILDKKLTYASQHRDIDKLKKKTADTLFGVPKDQKKNTISQSKAGKLKTKLYHRSMEEMIDAMDEAEDRRREERVFQEADRRQVFRNAGGIETKELLKIQEQIDELMKVLGFKTDGNGNDLGGIDHTTEFGRKRIERIWDENVLEWDRVNKLMVMEDRMMKM